TGTFVNRSTPPPGCGHLTSSQSIIFRAPNPSTTRGSHDERKLPPPTFLRDRVQSPALTVTRAPIPSGFDFFPTRFTPSQWLPFAALFFSSTGAASFTLTSTSTAPSLSKSPIASPRAANRSPKIGPHRALTSANRFPSL